MEISKSVNYLDFNSLLNSKFHATHKNPGNQNFIVGLALKVAKLWSLLLLLSKTTLKSKFKCGEHQKYRFLGKNRHFSRCLTSDLPENDDFWAK